MKVTVITPVPPPVVIELDVLEARRLITLLELARHTSSNITNTDLAEALIVAIQKVVS